MSMTIILNTIEEKSVLEQISNLIKDSDKEIVNTSDMKIAHCMGCNQCWLKTPGVCAIKDDYESILKKLVKADNLWLVSDTRFGFLDYKGKRMMDRIMPMLNMTIGFRDGWMRHELRYHALNIGLIYKGSADQAMLEDWCKRTAANIGGHSLGAIPLTDTTDTASTTLNPKHSTLNLLIPLSSTAAHGCRNSAIPTKSSIPLPKAWKRLASLGNYTTFPTARNGMRHKRLSSTMNVL